MAESSNPSTPEQPQSAFVDPSAENRSEWLEPTHSEPKPPQESETSPQTQAVNASSIDKVVASGSSANKVGAPQPFSSPVPQGNGGEWMSPQVSPVPTSNTMMEVPGSPARSTQFSRRGSASSIGSDRSLSRERARTLKISSKGKRVEIRLPSRERNNLPAMLGFELFRGFTRFAPGLWSGVALDIPKGKHDGKVEGTRYFRCKPRHGVFVLAKYIVYLDEDGLPTRSTSASRARPNTPSSVVSQRSGTAFPRRIRRSLEPSSIAVPQPEYHQGQSAPTPSITQNPKYHVPETSARSQSNPRSRPRGLSGSSLRLNSKRRGSHASVGSAHSAASAASGRSNQSARSGRSLSSMRGAVGRLGIVWFPIRHVQEASLPLDLVRELKTALTYRGFLVSDSKMTAYITRLSKRRLMYGDVPVTVRLASSATIKESEYIIILEIEPGDVGVPSAEATITCKLIGPRDRLAERLRRASCGAEAAGIMSVASTEFYTAPLPVEKPPPGVVDAMSKLTLADVCGLHEALMDSREASVGASEMIAKIANAQPSTSPHSLLHGHSQKSHASPRDVPAGGRLQPSHSSSSTKRSTSRSKASYTPYAPTRSAKPAHTARPGYSTNPAPAVTRPRFGNASSTSAKGLEKHDKARMEYEAERMRRYQRRMARIREQRAAGLTSRASSRNSLSRPASRGPRRVGPDLANGVRPAEPPQPPRSKTEPEHSVRSPPRPSIPSTAASVKIVKDEDSGHAGRVQQALPQHSRDTQPKKSPATSPKAAGNGAGGTRGKKAATSKLEVLRMTRRAHKGLARPTRINRDTAKSAPSPAARRRLDLSKGTVRLVAR